MRKLNIISDGTLGNTVILIDNKVVSKIQKLSLDLDEDGNFNASISYGDDNSIKNKNIFSDVLDEMQFDTTNQNQFGDSFSNFEIKSNGIIDDNTLISLNGKFQDGLTHVHINLSRENIFEAWLKYRNYQNKIIQESLFK